MPLDLEEDPGDPYSLHQTWEPSFFCIQKVPSPTTLKWDDKLPEIRDGFIGKELYDVDGNGSKVFGLDTFNHTLEPIETAELALLRPWCESEASEETSSDERSHLDDIWTLPSIPCLASNQGVVPQKRPSGEPLENLYTTKREWKGHGADELMPAYDSETGELGQSADEALIQACLCLAMTGRDSVLFLYDEHSEEFVPSPAYASLSGIDPQTMDAVIYDVLQCGSHMRRVEDFTQSVFANTSVSTPLAGLAYAAFVVHGSLQFQLSTMHAVRLSFTSLDVLSRRLSDLLGSVDSIILSCQRARSDGEVVSALFQSCGYYESQFSWLSGVFHEILTLATSHWFSLLEGWIGLRSGRSSGSHKDDGQSVHGSSASEPNFTEPQEGDADVRYRSEALPEFLRAEYGNQIYECGKHLRMLRAQHPYHPLAKQIGQNASRPLSLRLAADWTEVEGILARASEYEMSLQAEISKYHSETGRTDATPDRACDEDGEDGAMEPAVAAEYAYDLIDIDRPWTADNTLSTCQVTLKSKLHVLIKSSGVFNLNASLPVSETSEPQYASLVYYSFMPAISAQTRLINYSCLALLLQEHQLRLHLEVQWRFQLLRDGVFSSRLSMVLFDPDMHSGERQRNVAIAGVSSGLRLGSRATWPPAGSEVQLVLMGLLADCYHGYDKRDDLRGGNDASGDELPGGLSFAIRQLNEEDKRKFRDPDSIEALDFLRLMYTPPPVLENVITVTALEGYDAVFKHLLRMSRLLAVVHNLARHSTARWTNCNERTTQLHLFRMEALRFIETLAEYFSQYGIGRAWESFDGYLKRIEDGVARGDIDSTLACCPSMTHLKEHHEATLDRLLFVLFLDETHFEVRQTLDHIFEIILLFAPVSANIARAVEGDGLDLAALAKRVSTLHRAFRQQTQAFVWGIEALYQAATEDAAMKAARSQSGTEKQQDTDVASVYSHLLLRLAFSQ